MLNRTLGFVNASAFMQRVIARCAGACCDIGYYRERRDALCEALRQAGYEFQRPAGGMFCFPRTPIPDDVRFIDLLTRHGVLAVPGSGFGRPGHMRLSFGVPLETITRAAPLLRAAREEALAL
jgi:aspartate aminotransferase